MNVLVSGANGYIGSHLISSILSQTTWSITALVTNKEKMLSSSCAYPSDRVSVVETEEFFDNSCSKVNAAVHLAFSRRNRPESQIAKSIDFSSRFFQKLAEHEISNIILVSSQSVYGNTNEIRTETTEVAPNSVYAMAKYATEKVFESIFAKLPQINRTCVRLDSVIQSQNLVSALCAQAKHDGMLRLVGGKQVFSYIDIEDAVEALISLLKYNSKWKPIYNVGVSHNRITLLELADLVSKVSLKYDKNPIKIKLEENDIVIWAGMDSSLFSQDTGWHPKYTTSGMVERIYNMSE